MTFPTTPTDGQTFTENTISYTYNATKGAWLKSATTYSPALSTTLIKANNSIVGGGSLAADVTLSLKNDLETPPANTFYSGTGNTATRTWQTTNQFYYNNSASYLSDKSYQVLTPNSVVGGGDFSQNRVFQLENDAAAPGNNKVYGTDSDGVRGWRNLATTVPSNALNSYVRAFNVGPSVFSHGGLYATLNIKRYLQGDVANPGNNAYYGTNDAGARGWQTPNKPVFVGRLTQTASITYSTASYIRSFNDYIPISANKTYLFCLTAMTAAGGNIVQAVTSAPMSVVCGGVTDSYGNVTGSMLFTPTTNMNIFVRAQTALTHLYSDLVIYRLT